MIAKGVRIMDAEWFFRDLRELFSSFWVKFTGSLVFAGLMHHAFMLGAFSLLVLLDLVSRWLAIASEMLEAEGRKRPTLWEDAAAIPRARRLGLISSRVMKDRGTSKLLMYCLCVGTAAAADGLLASAGGESGLVPIAVGYLAMTEALSVTENLSDAGVPGMERLWELLRKR